MEKIFTNIKERVLYIADYKGIPKEKFFSDLGVTYGNFKGKAKEKSLSSDLVAKIVAYFPDISIDWIITGKGSISALEEKTENKTNSLIPLFEDVRSIGGHKELAVMDAQQPSELINVGDWFRDASAVIRHYGDSMNEYPSGCLIAVKEVKDKRLLVWGRNYCIETTEFRVTKRLQACSDDTCVMAHSTNRETSSDGALIYAPMMIPKDAIVRIYMVLGCVMVEDGNHVHLSR